jgi:hypothetical protein
MPSLVAKVGKVELFIHDSLHTCKNTLFEMEQAASVMPPCGVMLIDDIRSHAHGSGSVALGAARSWWDHRRRRQATAALSRGGVPLAGGDRGDGRHAGDHDAHGIAAPGGTGNSHRGARLPGLPAARRDRRLARPARRSQRRHAATTRRHGA